MSSKGTICDSAETIHTLTSAQVPDYQLIETMRWEPLSGILRFDLHMARLENSALALGFTCDMHLVRRKVTEVSTGETPLKLRLTLAPDGTLTIFCEPYTPIAPQTVWRIAIARARIKHDDPLLRHKTTRRQIYLAAREEFAPSEIDEVILLNDRDEVCEGTITSIFLDMDGSTCVTPSLSCGLLDGVLRREMLDNRIAQEKVVSLEDIKNARNVFVGNSLRGIIRAKLEIA